MASAIATRGEPRVSGSAVRTLRPEDAASLRLPGIRGTRTLKQALVRHPGRSVWLPETLEYALLAPWRHRPEISHVDDLDAVRNTEPLLRAAFERCVANGDELMLAIEMESYGQRSRFERAGLAMLEEVITYEIDAMRAPAVRSVQLHAAPVTALDERSIGHVLRIDQTAFPWLWRNNRAEFDVYLRTPGAAVSLLIHDRQPVAYVGSTLFNGWGHLDRIAVLPDAQGHGLGREALAIAVDALRRQGARRVALSTQQTNWRSQRLYARFGFQRTPELDYRLFGAWCRWEAEGGRRETDGETARRRDGEYEIAPTADSLLPSAIRRPPSAS